MLYSEFVKGTGCKDSEYNYKVYKDLEVMYMNSDMTKNEIYEYGKKLVDNSKSASEVKFEKEIEDEIKQIKNDIQWLKLQKERYESYISGEKDEYYKKLWKGDLANIKREIKTAHNKISMLKAVLN